MTELFLKLLNMSITAGWIVLAVMLLRLFLQKAPKWVHCLLWAVVALRLVMPFSLESIISLIPSPEVIPQDIAVSQTPVIYSAIPVVNSAVNPLFTGYVTPGSSVLEKGLFFVSAVWLAGVGMMLLYSLLTYIEVRKQVRVSLLLRDNIYVCDDVESPFILGIFRPRIYIPSGMDAEALAYVLAHEKAHIQRRDHWWKPLGFLLLAIYWFNPLLWVAYILLCRDIELACDEKVIAGLDTAGKKGYSQALLTCSVHRRIIMACPVAFGEVSVKSRIKSVLRYKKPALWVAVAAVAICVLTAACFLTNPMPCKHVYESQVLVDATCTRRGLEKRTCSLCEHNYTAYVEKCDHSYERGSVVKAPTCAKLGSIRMICADCGKVKIVSMEKLPHTAGETFVSKEANCTEQGELSAKCVECRATFVAELLPTNDVHDMKETVLREPTCTATGEGVNTCTRCGHSESITYEAAAHNYRDGREIAAVSCDDVGQKQKVCTVCGHEIWEPTTGGEHFWPKNSFGGGYYPCLWCGASKPKNNSEKEPDSTSANSKKEPSELLPDDLFPVIEIWP